MLAHLKIKFECTALSNQQKYVGYKVIKLTRSTHCFHHAIFELLLQWQNTAVNQVIIHEFFVKKIVTTKNISMFSLGGLVWGVTIWLPGRQAGPCWWPRCQTRSCPCSCPDWRTWGIAGSRQWTLPCLSAVTAEVLGWAELISLLLSHWR